MPGRILPIGGVAQECAATMLDELIARYGKGAVLTVRPYVLDSGETLRWVVEIDGEETPEMDVRIEEHSERPELIAMSLVRGDEEIQIGRWSKERYPHGPAQVIWTLGGLRRWDAERFSGS